MAIPEGRMSTTVVEKGFLPPEGNVFRALTSYEIGPTAIEDTTMGLIFQDWTLTWDVGTGDFIATPADVGIPVVVHNVADVVTCNFTFDQAGRIIIAYTTSISSYLWWYDTVLGQTTTKDLGVTSLTPTILLDDKRDTQNVVNDMLLWYTEDEGGGTYELFMLRQRDRFLTVYSMLTGLQYGFIHNTGMSNGLRVQMILKAYAPG